MTSSGSRVLTLVYCVLLACGVIHFTPLAVALGILLVAIDW